MLSPAASDIDTARFDLGDAEAYIVRADSSDGAAAAALKQFAIESLQRARKILQKAEKQLENELYQSSAE
jgi:hypothetical protein